MAKELLTAKSLDQELKKAQAEAAARRTRVRISDGNNLQLVVRNIGGASWQLLAWVNGKRKPITLGRYPDVTLKRARDLAEAARDTVAGGADQVEEKRLQRIAKARDEAGKDLTVRTLMNDWLEKHPGSTVSKMMAEGTPPRPSSCRPPSSSGRRGQALQAGESASPQLSVQYSVKQDDGAGAAVRGQPALALEPGVLVLEPCRVPVL